MNAYRILKMSEHYSKCFFPMYDPNYPHFTGLAISSQAKQTDQAQVSCKGTAEI